MLEIRNDLFFLNPFWNHDIMWILSHNSHVVPGVGNCNFIIKGFAEVVEWWVFDDGLSQGIY